jgi:hypothetical protein
MVNGPVGSGAAGKHQVWIFFALTLITALIISQVIFQMNLDIYNTVPGSALYLLYVLCPAIFAAIMLAVFGGRDGILSLARGLANWKVGVQWYIVAIIISLIAEGITTIIFIATGNHIPSKYTLAPLSLTITAYVIIGAIGLAIGLGYVFSVMVKAYGPVLTAAIAGIFLIIYKGLVSYQDPNIVIMSIGLFAIAFLLVWLYYYARDSVLILAIFLALYVYMSNIITYSIAADSGLALPIFINKVVYIVMIAAIMVLDMGFFFEERPRQEKGKAVRPNG